MYSRQDILTLVQEVLKEDPVDFGYLRIGEEEALELILTSTLEHFNKISSEDVSTREAIYLSTIVKLNLENFVLNAKLNQLG